MKIVLKYKQQYLLYNSQMTYQALAAFIKMQLQLEEEDFYLTFQDQEKDQITLSGESDLVNAIEMNLENSVMKINVKENQQKKINFNVNEKNEKKQNILDQQGTIKENKEQYGCGKRGKRHSYSRQSLSKKEFTQNSSSEEREPNRGNILNKTQKCIKQTISKQVDQRIKTLIPCLKAILLGGNPIKQLSVQDPLTHEGIECKGCFATPIVGFRYKCLQCSNFNLCQRCEPNIEHDHNMLKIKKLVIPQTEETNKQLDFEQLDHPRYHGRRHHGHRHHDHHDFMPHHPFEFFGHPLCGPSGFGFGPFGPRIDDSFAGNDRCNFEKGDFCLIKKCHKLANIFGGEPQKYKEFASKYMNLRRRQFIDKYAEQNKIEETILNQKMMVFKCQKVAAFFNKKPEDYKDFVQKNKDLRPRQIIRLLIDSGAEVKPQNGQCWGRWSKWNKFGGHHWKNEKNSSRKQQRKSKEEKGKSQNKDSIENKTTESLQTDYREQNKKQGKIFKTFIDIFGKVQAKDYFKFIKANFKDCTQEQLIEKWITRAN